MMTIIESSTGNIDAVAVLKTFSQQNHLFKFRNSMKLKTSLLFSVDRSSVCLNKPTTHKGLLLDLTADCQMTW